MEVLMIVGSLPPEPCGVSDYTVKLVDSINANTKHSVKIMKHSNYSLWRISTLMENKIVHIQYPSKGYGASFIPQLLAIISNKSVTTIHEFSQVHILRKLAISPFLLFSQKIIVTNEFELMAILSWFPFIRRRVSVIPVGAAMLPSKPVQFSNSRRGLVFFGLMRKDKGIEEFIELVRLLRNKIDFPIAIYSAVPNGNSEYYADIRRESADLPIEWHINKSLDSVSEGLLTFQFAYLHFPDGLSERRSSFIAAISHGLIVLSNSTDMTSKHICDSFIDVSTPNDAVHQLNELVNNPHLIKHYQEYTIKAAKNYSWMKISMLHANIYESFGV